MTPARHLRVCGAALAAVLLAAPAFADAPTDDEAACPEGQVRDPKTSECQPKPKRRLKKKRAKKAAPPAPPAAAAEHAQEPADAGTPPAERGQLPKRDESTEGPRTCPEGQKLERVVCIRAPCPPQCVPIAR